MVLKHGFVLYSGNVFTTYRKVPDLQLYMTTHLRVTSLVSDKFTVKLMTHTTQICGIFDVTNLPRHHPRFTAMLFQWSHVHCQCFLSQICRCYDCIALLPFQSINFLCDFVLQLVETAVSLTVYMIQHMFTV